MNDFLSYLSNLEVDSLRLMDDTQRSSKLWNAVVPSLRDECRLRPHQGTYDQLVAALANAENSSPARTQLIEDARVRRRRWA